MVPRKMGDNTKSGSAAGNGEPQNAQIIIDASFLPQEFKYQSKKVAKDVVYYVSRGGQNCEPAPDRVTKIMRNLVDDTLQERTNMMRDLVLRLNIRNREQISLLESVANNMFDDEQVNWGRIVTFHAFCAYVAKFCEDTCITDCQDDIISLLSDFTVNRLGLWIVTHGGWKAFETQFPTLCVWAVTGMWKGILITALLLGGLFAFFSSVMFISKSGE